MDRGAISGQIDRILRSQSLASKGQLRKLLEILAKNWDAQSTLKPEGVIQELWPDETRTKRPADVATEINRLRRALDSYYRGEGRSDPIVISLPNRSPQAANGAQEKRWIAAHARSDLESQPPIPGAMKFGGTPKILAALATLAVAAFFALHWSARDSRPHAALMEGPTLTILNAEGKALWSKSFSEGFVRDWYYERGLASRIWFGDLDGDGHTSVLFLYFPAERPDAHSSTLICYSDRGKEKWRWTPGRPLPELEGSPATFRTVALAVSRATKNYGPRIVVSSVHAPWFPNQIAVLDSNGKMLSEYWHSGHLETLALADLDGDGREEIFASGISNGYRQATLIVLDPDRVFGASAEPARPEVQIHGMGTAQERLRLLFPRSDINQAASVYNIGGEVTSSRGRTRFAVRECAQLPGCLIWYEFDRSFHLLSVVAADQFREAHAQFYRTGKDAHTLTPTEEAEFHKVRCLVGCPSEFLVSLNH